MKTIRDAVLELDGRMPSPFFKKHNSPTDWYISETGKLTHKTCCVYFSLQEFIELADEYLSNGASAFKAAEQPLENREQLDNSWHERGELPPVGAKCEMLDADLVWRKVEILAYTKKGMVVEWDEKEFLQSKDKKFRPIKSERESLIDSLKHEVYLNCINNLDCISMKQSTGEAVAAAVISYMLDAGFRAPEDK